MNTKHEHGALKIRSLLKSHQLTTSPQHGGPWVSFPTQEIATESERLPCASHTSVPHLGQDGMVSNRDSL